jgi:HAD superfamily hydrolase (TIGR01549 family)
MADVAILFDLDGTLVDSVYQHVLAWRQALESAGIQLSVWRIHRRIGMSGGLFVNALLREIGMARLPKHEMDEIIKRHGEAFVTMKDQVRPLPGSKELLKKLNELNVPWAIATSGTKMTSQPSLSMLEVPDTVPVVTREEVSAAKPDPDLFIAAAKKLGVPVEQCVVVGDSIWDMLAAQRARALGVGLLSGGYGREELERAGAYRVYDDPHDFSMHLDEIGVREP